MDGGPYCIENDPQGRSHGATNGVAPIDIQRPPSYFEVIGFFDPPPSYNDIQGIGNGSSGQHSDIRQVLYPPATVTLKKKRTFINAISKLGLRQCGHHH